MAALSPAVDTLAVQASLNGGAWPFDETERTLLDEASGQTIVAAYLPAPEAEPADPDVSDATHPVTRAVAAQYRAGPIRSGAE